MAVKMITKPTTQMLDAITDADITHVSLVKHGANRQGFRIVRSEEGAKQMFVHSIMVPADSDLGSLAALPGLGWISEISRDDRVDRDSYHEFVQAPREKFVEETIKLRKLEKTDAFVVVGELKKGADPDGLTLPPESVGAPIATIQTSTPLSFGELFYSELDSFVSTTMGVMGQSQMDLSDKKKLVMSAYSALGKFLEAGLGQLDSISNQPVAKAEDLKKSWREKALSVPPQQIAKAEGGGQMAINEELGKFITETVEKAVGGLIAKSQEQAKAVVESTAAPIVPETPVTPDPKLEELKGLVEQLGTTVTGLVSRVDTILKTPVKPSGSPEADVGTKTTLSKWDEFEGGPIPKDKRKGLFRGSLIDWPGSGGAAN